LLLGVDQSDPSLRLEEAATAEARVDLFGVTEDHFALSHGAVVERWKSKCPKPDTGPRRDAVEAYFRVERGSVGPALGAHEARVEDRLEGGKQRLARLKRRVRADSDALHRYPPALRILI